jgi:hypothetical protein
LFGKKCRGIVARCQKMADPQEQSPMPDIQQTPTSPPVSPLVLADRLITLAREADRAGYTDSASRLVGMALAVFDETPRRKH